MRLDAILRPVLDADPDLATDQDKSAIAEALRRRGDDDGAAAVELATPTAIREACLRCFAGQSGGPTDAGAASRQKEFVKSSGERPPGWLGPTFGAVGAGIQLETTLDPEEFAGLTPGTHRTEGPIWDGKDVAIRRPPPGSDLSVILGSHRITPPGIATRFRGALTTAADLARRAFADLVTSIRLRRSMAQPHIYRGVRGSLVALPAGIDQDAARSLTQTLFRIETEIIQLRAAAGRDRKERFDPRVMAITRRFIRVAQALLHGKMYFNPSWGQAARWARPFAGELGVPKTDVVAPDAISRFAEELESTGYILRMEPPRGTSYSIDDGLSDLSTHLGVETVIAQDEVSRHGCDHLVFRILYRGTWYWPEQIEPVTRATNHRAQKILDALLSVARHDRPDAAAVLRQVAAVLEQP